MKKTILAATAATLFLLQPCLAQVDAPARVQEAQQTQETVAPQETKTANPKPAATAPTPVAFESNIAKLSPENTSIGFIGRHVTEGDAPDPEQRLGGFRKFNGEVHLGEDGKSLKAMVLDIDTDSIFTAIPDLTAHLKKDDFLNVGKFPKAKFASTEIKSGEKDGQYSIVGDFTLLEKTQSITIPCTVKMSDKGILIDTEFKLDRTMFGMNNMVDKVASMVSIKMNVGTKTAAQANGRGNGQRRGGRGGSPADRFKAMDANGDGKIAGDEIPERMKQFLPNIDTDGNGELTLEEMEAAMKKRRGGGNRGDRG